MSSPFSDPVAVIDCDTAVRRLWDFLDHELDAVRFAEVEQHVATCHECAAHVDFSQQFLAAVAAHWQEAPTAEALRARVVATLKVEGFQTA
jgi:anti-sigma factor (TIGR02949 family)